MPSSEVQAGTVMYTGVGHFNVPDDIYELVTTLSDKLGQLGFGLRSGALEGVETAFEIGALQNGSPMRIYMPTAIYNNRIASSGSPIYIDAGSMIGAQCIAQAHCKNWNKLEPRDKRFLIANVSKVYGYNLQSVSKFLIYWVPEGKEVLTINHIISVAREAECSVINLADYTDCTVNKILREILKVM